GKLDKLQWKGGRGELHLQSMTITFPDGYVVPTSGPMTLVSDEGYAVKDPGSGRCVGAFALPAAGVGVGALIGHAAGRPSRRARCHLLRLTCPWLTHSENDSWRWGMSRRPPWCFQVLSSRRSAFSLPPTARLLLTLPSACGHNVAG